MTSTDRYGQPIELRDDGCWHGRVPIVHPHADGTAPVRFGPPAPPRPARGPRRNALGQRLGLFGR